MTMGFVPNDPFKQLTNMRHDVGRVFNSFPNPFDGNRNVGEIPMDVQETDQEVIATCDIPGLEQREDLNIQVDKTVLQVSGVVNKTAEQQTERMHRQERYKGNFNRSVSLPAPVSAENVSATYKNGVLVVRMQKLQNETRRTVDVDFL